MRQHCSTRFVTRVALTVPTGADHTRCQSLLEKAEHGCLVANSLRAPRLLEVELREG